MVTKSLYLRLLNYGNSTISMGVEEISNEVKELIMNKSFLSYIFNPDIGNKSYWTIYLRKHPENIDSFNKAKYILQHLELVKSCFREEELLELKIQIRECILHSHTN